MFCIVWLIIHAALIWLYTDALMHVSFLLILLIMNLSAFIAYAADKAKAMRHAWRIRESALIILTVSGGSLGAFAAMTLFRHKISDMPLFRLSRPADDDHPRRDLDLSLLKREMSSFWTFPFCLF